MMQLTSLKQKVAIFIILPTFLIMIGAGGLGLRLIGNVLLQQWQETAISKLQQSAHYVDMRLMRPKELLRFFQQNDQKDLQWRDIQLLIAQLRAVSGVVEVKYDFTENHNEMMGGMHRLQKTTVSPMAYNMELKSQTVSLVAEFVDNSGKRESTVEVVVSFFDLVDQIVKSPWWKGNQAFILDKDGAILASTLRSTLVEQRTESAVFGQSDSLERDTWEAIQKSSSGTVFTPGAVPERVSGFYHLVEAPWTLVVIAPGDQVLQPIVTFRAYYYALCVFGILFAVIYIWLITNKATRSINELSKAATDLASGSFSKPLIVSSRDEIGTLISSFNIMSKQLKERLQLQQEMSLAGEVQNNLLPKNGFKAAGLDVAGTTIYCDKTGGDYIDILNTSEDESRATIVVGDVVGHGIGASLLMATLRALLRGRASMPGTSAEITNDVNILLCQDTVPSGNFATLFYLTVNCVGRTLEWVRCGHDPALVFCPKDKSFTELKGDGLVLGFDETWIYTSNTCAFIDPTQVILVGTDGIWDVENSAGDQFGKERTKALLAQHCELPAEELVAKITAEIEIFRGAEPQNDDITLAIIKTG